MKKSDGKKASATKVTAKKASATSAKASSAPRKTTKKKKVAPVALSSAARIAVIKPPEAYGAMMEQVIASWQEHKKIVRIDGRSPGRLRSLFDKAKRARAAEDALKEQYEKNLRKLSDARLAVESTMWGEALDVYRVAKAMAPIRPEMEKAFDKMTEHFSRPYRTQPPAAPGSPPAVLRDADLEEP